MKMLRENGGGGVGRFRMKALDSKIQGFRLVRVPFQ